MHPPSERLGNKHVFFQNKQDTEQPVAVHALSFGKDMKLDSGSSESDILTDWDQGGCKKTELHKGFQF